MNSENDQLPVGLIAQLVEHCTGIAEVMGSNLFKPEFFHFLPTTVWLHWKLLEFFLQNRTKFVANILCPSWGTCMGCFILHPNLLSTDNIIMLSILRLWLIKPFCELIIRGKCQNMITNIESNWQKHINRCGEKCCVQNLFPLSGGKFITCNF